LSRINEKIANMPTNIRGKLTEPSGESKIRSPSVQELDLISGGFRPSFRLDFTLVA
jgi:hypothetical protein